MKQGKYSSSRRRRRRTNWTGIFFWIIVFAILVGGIVLVCKSCSRLMDDPETTPGTSLADTQPSTGADTTPSTEPTTEPATIPTTEATVPTTEETVPTTEETTVPTEPSASANPDYNGTLGQRIVAAANSVIGKPYFYGGSGPDSFDASGLIYYCLSQCDISASRTFSGQFTGGEAVDKEHLQPGDIVFFYQVTPGEAEYAGIYIGDGNFIAVSSSNNAVEVKNMTYNTYYADRYIGARRYLG